MLMVKTSKN